MYLAIRIYVKENTIAHAIIYMYLSAPKTAQTSLRVSKYILEQFSINKSGTIVKYNYD